eukprot:TRINITY_DN19962_c0_g1_i1.p1 TRINITY_DN19962_c0_g1~~TRINITY_DN19962_c0_g1_i1.p1  ORF type:complete len:289 (+),score=32.71 TRINITY_DN19962_c0_g1_i1:217-1083(+)
MDPAVQEALLRDPKVQEALRNAGEAALQDPRVQQQMLETCREKFPEYASKAQVRILEMAKDPAMQEKAKSCAGIAAGYIASTPMRYIETIEQGPEGLRAIAFLGGCFSCAVAVSKVLNPLKILAEPDLYILSFYQLLFSITMMMFELKPSWVDRVACLGRYQNLLLDKARFAAESMGRGLFYGFQGTLWIVAAKDLSYIGSILVAIHLIIVGLLYALMHFGIMPQHMARKVRHAVGRRTLVEADAPDLATIDSMASSESSRAGGSLSAPHERGSASEARPPPPSRPPV